MPIVALRTEMEILNRPNPVGDFSLPYQILTWPYICFYKLSYAFNSVTAPGGPRLPSLLYYCGCQRVTLHRSHLFICLFVCLFIYSSLVTRLDALHSLMRDIDVLTGSCSCTAIQFILVLLLPIIDKLNNLFQQIYSFN